MPSPLRQGLRYGLFAAVGLAAIVLSESVLQNTSTLYLAFDPRAFAHEAWFLVLFSSVFGLLGAWLDSNAPSRPRLAMRSAVRMGLFLLLYVALFQVFRRSVASSLALTAVWKVGLLTLCLLAAWRTVRRASDATQQRIASAASVTLLMTFMLQPGMPSYLLKVAMPSDHSGFTEPARGDPVQASSRRTVVVILDEWDYEISLREGFFQQPSMAAMLNQAFYASQARPAGPNTLVSVPGMIRGQAFGPVSSGSPGTLVNTRGEKWAANQSSLFSDLDTASIPYSIVGFFHDYCSVFPGAKHCHSEPVNFFPGWWSAATRALRKSNDFDNPYTDFLRQWSGTYQRIHDDALRTVAAQKEGLVWLHINLPHPPAASGGSQPQDLRQDYRANLQLAQKFIDELVTELKRQGPDFALVLTSDHWLREKEMWRDVYVRQFGPGSGDTGKTDDKRVPFVVYFGEANGGAVTFDQAMSTMSLRKLAPKLALRQLNNSEQVAAFFKTEGATP